MAQIISKEELEKLMKIKGEIRGVALKEVERFVREKEGEEGLKKLEKTMAELGYPIKYNEIKSMGFYKLSLKAILLITVKRLFNYSDEKFQEMGKFETKSSPMALRLFARYFISLDTAVKAVQKMWRVYYSTGILKVIELNKKEKYAILRLEDFRLIPPHCENLKGYFSGVLEMIIKQDVTCEETKCVYKGDKYHEFLMKW